MLVIVSDTSAIIDLRIAGLLKKLPKLPYDVVIPTPLFEEELLDFTDKQKEKLISRGFSIRHLSGEGVSSAMSFFEEYSALSLNDCFALSLTREIQEESVLLTGDRKLRQASDQEDVNSCGILWVISELHDKGICSSKKLQKSLNTLRENPRVFIPDELITKTLKEIG